MGAYSYTYSIANYFVLFAMLGVNNYGTRTIAAAGEDNAKREKAFWGIWVLQLSLACLSFLIYLGYSVFGSEQPLLAFIWLPYIISAAFDVNWLFFGLEKFKITVTRNFIVKLSTFALTFVVVRGESALENYLALMSVSLLASVAVLWPFVLREMKPYLPKLDEVLSHLKPNLVLFIPVVAISLYTVLDKVMLGLISGMSETGIFENSLKVASMPFSIITALGSVMLPRASSLFASGGAEEVRHYIGPSIWFALLLSSAFTFGLIAIAPEFVPIFFGAEFAACSIVMPVIVLEMPFMAWANVIRTQYLIPSRNDRAYVLSVIIGALVNFVVNICLIPRFGALGAGIGTLAAEVAVCLVQSIAIVGKLPFGQYFMESLPGFGIGLLMLLIVRWAAPVLPEGVLGLVLEIMIGAASFTIMAVAWFAISRNQYANNLLFPMAKRAIGKMRRGRRV